jgi:predicted permease
MYFIRENIRNIVTTVTRTPGYFISLISTLSVTLGALICAFSLNYLLFLKPLPYLNSERLVLINHSLVRSEKEIWSGFQRYQGLIDAYKKSQSLDVKSLIQNRISTIENNGKTEQIKSSFVTHEYFEILSATATKGRLLNEEERMGEYSPHAVISYQAWGALYGFSPDVLDKNLNINNKVFKIVGVLSKDFVQPKFNFDKDSTDVFLPWDFNIDSDDDKKNFMPYNLMIGRVAHGNTIKTAEHEVNDIVENQFLQEVQGVSVWKGTTLKAKAIPFNEAILGDSAKSSLIFFAAVLAMLAVAIVNAINIILFRFSDKQRLFAVHAAVGATPSRILFLIGKEFGVTLFATAVLAIFISIILMDALKNSAGSIFPRLSELSIYLESYFFALFSTFVLLFILTIVGYKSVNYRHLIKKMNASGKGNQGNASSKARTLIVSIQLVFTLVISAATISTAENSIEKVDVKIGGEIEKTFFLTATNHSAISSVSQIQDIHNLIVSELKNLPFVESATSVSGHPLTPNMIRTISLNESMEEKVETNVLFVDENFINTTALKVISGNVFSDKDTSSNSNKVMIGKQLAINLFGDENPIGQKLFYPRRGFFDIVAVIEDINLPRSTNMNILYLPAIGESFSFLVRMKNEQENTREIISKSISSISPEIKIFDYASSSVILRDLISRDVAIIVIATVVGLLTIILSAIGLYGVINYEINLRKYEFGVRMAIGARSIDIIKEAFKTLGRSVIIGTLISFPIIILINESSFVFFSEKISIDYWGLLLASLIVLTLSFVIAISSIAKIIRRLPIYSISGK